jgi:ABC-type uncharacterized transport system substrate-binding protein
MLHAQNASMAPPPVIDSWRMNASLRIVIFAALAAVGVVAPAAAHPHVWVTMNTELVYAPDGSVTGVRHTWAFDDMFSAFATQGLESKVKDQFTREELAPLAKENVESLKEFDYFTYATADGVKVPFSEPRTGYWADYKDSIITLHFILPFKAPVKAKNLTIEVYDPTYFVAMELAKQDPVHLIGAPAGCKLSFQLPHEMTYAEGKKLSNEANAQANWGANFANKIMVNCP